MSVEPIVHLRDFIASTQDPRALVLDVRLPAEREARPLSNRFFPVIYAPRDTLAGEITELATLLGGRHVIVVDTVEARARIASRLLRELEVEAAALEGGFEGWLTGLVSLPDQPVPSP